MNLQTLPNTVIEPCEGRAVTVLSQPATLTVRYADKPGCKSRVYVEGFGDEVPTDAILEPMARHLGLPTIYTARGDHKAMDALWDAVNARVVEEKRQALASLMPNLEARFSRKAGCACGCSPGFIAENVKGFDIWITKKKG